MDIKIDVCSRCSHSLPIVNKKYYLCETCNHLRLHGKTYQEKIYEREKTKCITIVKKHKVSNRNRIKRQQVLDLDRTTYEQVFCTLPNCCEECQVLLNTNFDDHSGRIVAIWQYSHILSKGAYPEFRHNPKNFNRLCLEHHNQWEFGDRQSMKIYRKNQVIVDELLRERNEERNI